MQPGPQLVQPEPVQPGVFLVVRLAEFLQHGIVVGQGAGFGQGAGEGAGLGHVVVGSHVVLGGGEGSVEADDDDQGRQGLGAEREALLHD